MRFGIAVPHLEYEYSQKLLEGVRQYVTETDNDVFIFSTKEPDAEESEYAYQEWFVSKFINNRNIDGVVFPTAALGRYCGEQKMKNIIREINKTLPVVSIISEIDGIPSLIVDSENAFKNMIEHLVREHGRSNILFMGIDCESQDIRDRLTYFKEIMEDMDLKVPDHHIIYGDYIFESAIAAMKKNFPTRESVDFDAVVCVTDELALGTMTYLSSLGFSVPEDICVTGFDNTVRSLYSYPSLTTVNQNVPGQCYEGFKILEKFVNGKKVSKLNVMQSECSYRASCGCIPKNSNFINKTEKGSFISRNEDFYSRAFASFFVHNDQNLRVLNFVDELQSSLSLEMLCSRLEKYLYSFDINQSALCLYDHPLEVSHGEDYRAPSMARIYYSSDRLAGVKIIDSKDYFDCEKKLLPDGMLDRFKGIQVVKSIFHGKYQYGYMILSLGSYDCAEYIMIYSLICKFIASAFDVTSYEEKNTNLAELSKTDELTGILNRRGFMIAAQQELNIAASLGKKGLVVYGDMDGLKNINDTYGHDAGDRAIRAEVELLKKTFRAADTMARLGGDEFAILSISLDLGTFEKLKKKLDDLCDEWNRNSNEEFRFSISLGAVSFDSENYNLTQLLKLADAEQYKEKKRRKEARG